MKKIGFLSFGHWSDNRGSATRSRLRRPAAVDRPRGRRGGTRRGRGLFPRPSFRPAARLAVSPAGRRRRADPADRDRHRCDRHALREPLRHGGERGGGRPHRRGRLQLGLSRGSPEQVIDGWRHFGFTPAEGETEADMGRRHAETFLTLLDGKGFAQPNPRPMFANPPGLLRIEPHAAGLRDRIWWGSSSNATAVWAARMGMNLQSST